MKATYEITTVNGKTRRFEFTEHHSEGDYGNGNYISVLRLEDDELLAYLDMRYEKYNFESACLNYIRSYFSTNLLTYTKI